MDKQAVVDFFDGLAPHWDEELIRNDSIIHQILDGAAIAPGMAVLDVACGTGVLFPDYLAHGVTDITAIDISPRMAALAQKKFPQVRVLCGDVEQAVFDRPFDAVMVYNAFPHFPEPERLIRHLAGLLKPGGTLTVAHGMSRAAIDQHHQGHASKVSNGLMHEDQLADIFSQYLTVTVKLSTEHMYQVTGQK